MTSLPVLRMGGAEKAAALLLAMDKSVAARILKRFDKDELRRVTRSATRLGRVPASALDEILEEFVDTLSTGGDLVVSAGEAQQLLTEALSEEEASSIMSDVMGRPGGTPWERAGQLPDGLLAGYLVGEHPQVAAFVLSRVSTACAATVLGSMPSTRRNEITRRMIGLRPVGEAAVAILEADLEAELLATPAEGGKVNPHARVADMMNRLDRSQAEDVLQTLSRSRPEAADALRSMMFSFEDLGQLSVKGRLILFEKVSPEKLILALNGADAELRELVLSSLTARARRMVEGELANGQEAPPRDVEKARRAIAETALELAERGEIELNPAVAA